MISASPKLSLMDPGTGHPCMVLDDVLLDPQALVEQAARHRDAFQPAAENAYPGLELPLPESVVQAFVDAFNLHARNALGVRRVLTAAGRLALVTRQPRELAPIQRLCHRDRLFVEPGQRAVAGVLYLFHDEALGGTNFFRVRKSQTETEALMARAAHMTQAEADAAFGVPAGYLTQSNDWFELAAVAPPRWNRLIFFDGGKFHSSHITRPELLSDDPARGRLTLNLFMTARCVAE